MNNLILMPNDNINVILRTYVPRIQLCLNCTGVSKKVQEESILTKFHSQSSNAAPSTVSTEINTGKKRNMRAMIKLVVDYDYRAQEKSDVMHV